MDSSLRYTPQAFICSDCVEWIPNEDAWEGFFNGEHGVWDICRPCATRLLDGPYGYSADRDGGV